MWDIIKHLSGKLTTFISNKIRIHSVRKADLQQLLQTNISGHLSVEKVLSNFSNKDMNDWFNNAVKLSLKQNNRTCKDVYNNYLKKIHGKAQGLERSRVLSSLCEANAAYAKVLDAISKKIDMLIETDSVTIFDMRLSFVAILGILRGSDLVLTFSSFLYSFLVRVNARAAASIPKYRDQFLITNCDKVASLVSLILDKKGPFTFLQDVDNMRKRNADLVLGATGQFKFGDFMVASNYSGTFIDNIFTALSCLNIFSAALDAWDDYRMDKYKKNQAIKEWLEGHVSLLRMDLSQMDKTSPEYMKLLNIVEAYDQEIADYDKAITDFEKED